MHQLFYCSCNDCWLDERNILLQDFGVATLSRSRVPLTTYRAAIRAIGARVPLMLHGNTRL